MLYFSSICIDSHNIKNTLSRLINSGVRNIELGKTEEYIHGVGDILKRFKEDYNLNFLVHNYFPAPKESFVLNLASQNNNILTRTVSHCKKAIKLAGKLNAPIYSIHGGLRLDPRPHELGKPIKYTRTVPYEKAYQTLVTSTKMLCDYALDFNVEIAIENNVLAEFNLENNKNELFLMCETEEFLRMFDDVQRKNLKLLVDTSHLNITSRMLKFDKVSFIKKLKEKISIFHLSDNNGREDTHEMINENSWFWHILGDFKKAKYVIESHNLGDAEIKLAEEIFQQKLIVKRKESLTWKK